MLKLITDTLIPWTIRKKKPTEKLQVYVSILQYSIVSFFGPVLS